MTIFDAILLAGDKEGAKSVLGKNKAFLEIRGIPSFIRVLSALQKVDSIGKIKIVGPADKVNTLLDKHSSSWQGKENVTVVSQQDNAMDNVWITFLEGFPEYAKGRELSREEKEKAIIVIASDIPLITPYEINEFISKCDLDCYDFFVGAVSDKTISCYAPKKGSKGIKMAVLPIKENIYRISNLHLLKPFKIQNRDRLKKMYELRYQRKLRNIFILFFKIVCLKGIKGAAFFYFLIQLELFCKKIGMTMISKYISSHLELRKLESIIGRIVGTRITVAETTLGGAALDVDNEKDYKIINEKYDEWMEYQKGLEG